MLMGAEKLPLINYTSGDAYIWPTKDHVRNCTILVGAKATEPVHHEGVLRGSDNIWEMMCVKTCKVLSVKQMLITIIMTVRSFLMF